MSHQRFETENRPRERLSRLGAGVLSDGELLAILLSTGTSEKSSIELGNEILKELGGLNGLARADISSLMSIKGVGEAKAAQLLAAMELAIRLKRADIQPARLCSVRRDVPEMLLPGFVKRKPGGFLGSVFEQTQSNAACGGAFQGSAGSVDDQHWGDLHTGGETQGNQHYHRA